MVKLMIRHCRDLRPGFVHGMQRDATPEGPGTWLDAAHHWHGLLARVANLDGSGPPDDYQAQVDALPQA